jgi:hypothetical protein
MELQLVEHEAMDEVQVVDEAIQEDEVVQVQLHGMWGPSHTNKKCQACCSQEDYTQKKSFRAMWCVDMCDVSSDMDLVSIS